ncbi:MAG: GIY-YIG nuclease family protein [Oleispira sp.]|nr:GIY-YIG nuclease family protein [Oleispira sp.]MBL4881532.1 GIY-YIG nuclease family protein [Oleispira sp.]
MARKLTTAEFIENSRKAHGNKFDYSKVLYVNKKTPVIVICPIHGEYEVQPHIHVRSDCRKCYLENRSENTAKTNEVFVSEAISVHGDTYDYSETEYINKRTKISIVCKIHGVFQQLPGQHLSSSGCLKCSIIEVGKKRSGRKNNRRVTNTKEFIFEAKIIHGDFFDYSDTVYIRSNDYVDIKCPKHGIFSQRANNHLTGFKCKLCSKDKTSKLQSLGTATFLERVKSIHGDRYDFSKVEYKSATNKVIVICPHHGEFTILPSHLVKGVACKLCSDESKTSSLKEFIRKSLLIHGEIYDYSHVDYINNNTTVKIGCPDHGVFEQLPRSHSTSGAHGCTLCNRFSFWDLSKLSPERLTEMNGVYVLILEERNTGNQLVKVGISKNVKQRCQAIESECKKFYMVKLLAYHPKILSESLNVEMSIHEQLANYSEHPAVRFAGETECFSIDSLPILVGLGLLDIEQLDRLNEGYELIDVLS